MGCQTCDPIGTHGTGCGLCRDGSASGETGTPNTSSSPTESPASVSVDIDRLRTGIEQSPYLSIIADLMLMLNGDYESVDVTPMLQIACQAIEFELAEQLLDELDSDAIVH